MDSIGQHWTALGGNDLLAPPPIRQNAIFARESGCIFHLDATDAATRTATSGTTLVATTTAKTRTSPADQRWGFSFGVDGFMTTAEACVFLKVTRWVIYDLVKRGDIRRGGRTKGMRLCKRSVHVYARSLET